MHDMRNKVLQTFFPSKQQNFANILRTSAGDRYAGKNNQRYGDKIDEKYSGREIKSLLTGA